MTAIVVLIGGLAGMCAVNVLHRKMLQLLTEQHRPFFISQLGAPTDEQLGGNSYSKGRRQLQGRFIRFRWSGEFLKLRDPYLNRLVLASIAAEVLTIACVVVAFIEIRLK